MTTPVYTLVYTLAAFAATACSTERGRTIGVALRHGDAARGKEAAERYGCNACHAIGGLPDPTVVVAAPITGIARRTYIAGTLATTPDNLVRWIRFPHEVKPATAMPDLAVTPSDARDIATYLYSLH